MNATISMLLVSIAPQLAPRQAAQEANPSEVGPRIPAEVSVVGRSGGALVLPTDCLERIADQATGSCLVASSTATLGRLFPYPGRGNVFAPPAFVGGGRYNQATGGRAVVGGGQYNMALANGATVAGGGLNTASGPRATIAGGASNLASGDASTVGGGDNNSAFGDYATVGGGGFNQASGRYATVAGGGGYASGYFGNHASADCATVGGGQLNRASGRWSTIGGGYQGYAIGEFATVPGGRGNSASGAYSFAAGRRARANHDGSFVWGDSDSRVKTSSSPDQFNVFCSGGARFFTNSGATTGVLLAAGGGSWSSVSDRDSKENMEPVDGRAVLERLASLPLSRWNYKAQDDSIRHIGPMAQDFREAFGLGVSDRLIDTIDADGVALAAIQGLRELVAENERRLVEKDAEIERLRAAGEALLARVERLEARERAE